MPPQFDKEKTKKTIRRILDKLKGGEDQQIIDDYRALFKKEVPLFRRSWMAAYLLMLHTRNDVSRIEKKRSRKSGSAGNPPAGEEGGNGQARRSLPDEESKRLFINAGRNRRVFSRELLGFINAKTSIPREDIGAIRILDNYSFIQVRDTVADEIIEALNGQLFRGRPLAVNYARPRRDAEEYSGEAPEYPVEESAGEELPEQDEDHPDEKEI